jgi:hypothetical protein
MQHQKRRAAGQKRNRIPAAVCIGLLSLSMLGACIGVQADITINRDGGGIIILEYRMSRLLESLGKLEGNAPWPSVPVGKADFERTVARIDGLELLSFSSKAGDDAVTMQVKLRFADPEALFRFLDSSGRSARFYREGGKDCISLTLGEEHEPWDPDLAALAAEVSEGYSIDIRFKLPRNAELTVTGAAGKPLAQVPAGTVTVKGGDVEFSAPLGGFISSPDPFTLNIRW